MDCSNSISLQKSPSVLLALAASSALFIVGCSGMPTMSSSVDAVSAAATVTGKIHGGNQAVSGAVVHVRFAGQFGLGKPYPSPYDIVATTTSAADGTGSFSFTKDPAIGASHPITGNTFACPNGANPFVYIEAIGGNTLGDGNTSENNTAAVFVAPLGQCQSISSATFVNLSEVTTAATMAALSQYFDPNTGAIGSDATGTATAAMYNSFVLAGQFVDLTKGLAKPSFTLTGSSAGVSIGVGGVSVTGTPEVSKLNQIANIISACVNTKSASSSACSTLFTNAVPANPSVTSHPLDASFPVATDVRQALYYIFTNPSNGSSASLQSLYNLAPAAGAPYQPSLSAAPTDWTVAVSYTSNGTCGAAPSGFINSASDLGVDSAGDVWFANAASNNLSAITNTGTPVACVNAGGQAKAGGVVDDAGNIWIAANPTGIIRFNPITKTSTTFTTAAQVNAIAADGNVSGSAGNSNIYFATAGSLYVIPAGATAAGTTVPTQISSVVGSPVRIAVDSSSTVNIWSVSGSSLNQTFAATSGANLLNGYSTVTYATTSPAYGVAVSAYGQGSTPTNNVFVSSGASANIVSKYTGSGTNYVPASGWPTAAGFAGLDNPTSLTLDGVSNVWATNFVADPNTLLTSVSEISTAKAALSPNGFQKAASYLGAGRATIVDGSGNVWVVGDGTSTITEIVGAAVPVCQPISYCITQKRFQTIP